MIDISSKGIRVWETAEIKAQVEGIFLDALGPDASLDPTSVNGQLIASITKIIQENAIQVVELFNNYSLESATGFFLNSIASLFTLSRLLGTPSTVVVDVLGATGTTLPYGFLISDGVKQFELRENLVIEPGTRATFYCTELGPYPVAPNSVNQIVAFAPGLDSVNNPLAGTPGKYDETDADFRARIRNSQYKNAAGLYESLEAALSEISTDFLFLENSTDASVSIEGVLLPAHTIYICSDQGTDAELGNAIFVHKSLGVGMLGDSEYKILMPAGNEMTIKFQRPIKKAVSVKVQLDRAGMKFNLTYTEARQLILAEFNKQAKIGAIIYATSLAVPLIEAGANVNYIVMKWKDDPWPSFSSALGYPWVDANGKTIPTLKDTDIEVVGYDSE